MKSELWKDIPNYPGYKISNFGRVKNKNNLILKPILSREGYYFVRPTNGDKRKNIYIHRLVAKEFIDNPNNLEVVNHKDGNKKNNNVNNLEWCTYSYNTIHSYKTNIRKKATKIIYQYDLDNNFIKEWNSIDEASKYLKINRGNIGSCCNKRRNTAGKYKWKFKEGF